MKHRGSRLRRKSWACFKAEPPVQTLSAPKTTRKRKTSVTPVVEEPVVEQVIDTPVEPDPVSEPTETE